MSYQTKSPNDSKIATMLQEGAVGIIPTDTVYGLVACAGNQQAATKLLEIKGRKYKPGTLIAADIDQLEKLGIARRYVKAVEDFWPNPISVVIPIVDPKLTYLHGGVYSLPVRIPKRPDLIKLLMKTGPLITTSANRPNKPVATTIKQAKNIFGQEVDFYVDGGEIKNHEPSTIIRIIDDEIEVIREGAVSIDENGRIKS